MCLDMVEGAWFMFAVMQVCEKYLAIAKDVFWAFKIWKRHMI